MSDDPMAFRLRLSGDPSTDPDAIRMMMRTATTLRTPVDKAAALQSLEVPTHSKLRLERPTQPPTLEILGRDAFLRELEREKRRADRAKTPLSVVRLHLGAEGVQKRGQPLVRRLVDTVNSSRRATDVVGELGGGIVGVLLPGTNDDGAGIFVQKVVERAEGLRIATMVITYPDDTFACLASGQAAPDEAAVLAEDVAAPARVFEDALKRAIDVTFSLGLLLALAPLMIVVAIMIAVTSPGPVIFRQSRLGKGGRPFHFYKFRSMRTSNDDSIHREFVTSLIQGRHADVKQQASADTVFKIKDDPRITRVGRFIRTSSIDELPQLFNVLKGDMSLVGPRPPLPYEAAHYQSWHLRRILEIRPGITGIWQVEGRSRVTFDEMVRMDLRYIKHRSLLLDLKLLLRTVVVVLARRGAK